MRRAILLILTIVFCFAALLRAAQQNPNSSKKRSVGKQQALSPQVDSPLALTSTKPSGANGIQIPSAIVIKLRASRDQPSAGSDFGISADVENVSDKAVYLNPLAFTMTAPPELDSDGPKDWYAWLPGPHVGILELKDTKSLEKEPIPLEFKKVVVIAPHSKMSAFWSGNLQTRSEKGGWSSLCLVVGEDCGTLIRNINFPPGKYTINVVGSYWDTDAGARDLTIEHRTEIAAIELPIVAAQGTILFGASLGGLFAYLLLVRPKRVYPDDLALKLLKAAADAFTSILLSVIVTILLARLSDTQFLIKVTISDFWGAIAVGFVASASGAGILRKFTGGGGAAEAGATDTKPERKKSGLQGLQISSAETGNQLPKKHTGGEHETGDEASTVKSTESQNHN